MSVDRRVHLKFTASENGEEMCLDGGGDAMLSTANNRKQVNAKLILVKSSNQ